LRGWIDALCGHLSRPSGAHSLIGFPIPGAHAPGYAYVAASRLRAHRRPQQPFVGAAYMPPLNDPVLFNAQGRDISRPYKHRNESIQYPPYVWRNGEFGMPPTCPPRCHPERRRRAATPQSRDPLKSENVPCSTLSGEVGGSLDSQSSLGMTEEGMPPLSDPVLFNAQGRDISRPYEYLVDSISAVRSAQW